MFDAFMGWELSYALEIGRELAAVKPVWLEEPLPPERIEGLRRLRNACGMPTASVIEGGESG